MYIYICNRESLIAQFNLARSAAAIKNKQNKWMQKDKVRIPQKKKKYNIYESMCVRVIWIEWWIFARWEKWARVARYLSHWNFYRDGIASHGDNKYPNSWFYLMPLMHNIEYDNTIHVDLIYQSIHRLPKNVHRGYNNREILELILIFH